MKGFFIEITNRLLEPKHRKAMRESVWFFMWLLDKITSINEQGIGKILGGKPIKFSEVEKDLNIPERTYRRWIATLKKENYINILRTPHGLVISVNKAKKRFGRRDTPKVAYRDVPKIARDVPKMAERTVQSGTSNIRQYQDNTKDRVISKKILDGKNELYKKLGWELGVAPKKGVSPKFPNRYYEKSLL